MINNINVIKEAWHDMHQNTNRMKLSTFENWEAVRFLYKSKVHRKISIFEEVNLKIYLDIVK